MKHLSPDELVDLLEGGAPASANAHVTSCERCAQRLEKLRIAMTLASEVEVPEPSPLFWEQLSARVRERVADEPAGAVRARWWRWSASETRRWVVPVAVGAMLLLVVAGALLTTGMETTPTEQTLAPSLVVGESTSMRLSTDVELGSEPADEAVWAVMADLTENLAWDEVAQAGLDVRPGSAEKAAQQLSREEQRELVRLLRAELAGGGS